MRSSPVVVAFAGLMMAAGAALAQEALRVSLAGQEAAEARRRAATAPGYYNLKLGDWRLRFSSMFGVEYDDNVNLEDTSIGSGTNRISNNPESDFILRPSFQVSSTVPVSSRNTLDLGVGVGYAYYLDNDDLSRLFVSPQSGISFDIYAGDWLINLHNRVTVTEESAASVSVSGTGNYGYVENTAGISGTWDLNRMVVELSYDFKVRASTSSEFNEQDTTQHLFRTSAALKINNLSSVGLETTMGLISYNQDDFSGGTQYSAGLFYRRQLGRHLRLQAGAGYFIYYLDDPSTNVVSSNPNQKPEDKLDGMYGFVAMAHQVNKVFGYRLIGGRQFQVDIFSENLDLYFLRLTTDWNVIRRMPISAAFSYENADETGGLGEKTDRFGGSLSIVRALTEKLSVSLNYYVYSRTSDLPGRNYVQNRVALTMGYRF
jgi:hypothetical protein